MGTIAQEISRLQTAKANLKTSIENKGVTVPSNTLISGYPALVDQITGGGGGGVTIPNFSDATYLFYSDRFTGIENDLLQKFTGWDGYQLYSGYGTAKASLISSFFVKAFNNLVAANTNGDVNFQYVTQTATQIDSNDNDLTIDLSSYNLTTNRTRTLSLNYIRAASGSYYNDVTLNFMLSNSQYQPVIASSNGLSDVRLTGNLKIYAYFNVSSMYLFNYTQNSGSLYEFHLVPVQNSAIIVLTNQTRAAYLNENTLIRSIALYDADEMTGKDLTIRLPSTLYNSLQQSTIDAATAVNITFST